MKSKAYGYDGSAAVYITAAFFIELSLTDATCTVLLPSDGV